MRRSAGCLVTEYSVHRGVADVEGSGGVGDNATSRGKFTGPPGAISGDLGGQASRTHLARDGGGREPFQAGPYGRAR